MFFQAKNRGMLVPVYLVACVIGILIIRGLVEYIFGEIHLLDHDMALLFGISMVVAGSWTYNTRDSFYIANGERKRMYEQNEFYYLTMEMWAYIYWAFGALCILGGILSSLGIVDLS